MNRKFFLFVGILLLIAISSVYAFGPVNTSLTNTYSPSQYLNIATSAVDMGSFWRWTYDVTPLNGAAGIDVFRINLGLPVTTGIIAVYNAKDAATTTVQSEWYWNGLSKGYISWIDKFGNQPINLNQTFRFEFDHPNGPQADYCASALGFNGYSGAVNGPASIPEPASLITFISVLGGTVSFLKRKK